MTCVIDGCDSTRIAGRGLCSSHYNMAWRAGRIEEYDLDPQATFPPVDFCRCPAPTPVPRPRSAIRSGTSFFTGSSPQ